MIIGPILFGIAVLLRFLLNMRYLEEGSGSDRFFHIYYMKSIKQNNRKLPEYEKRVIGGDNSCSYPYFFHLILGYFPSKYLWVCDKYLGFFLDFLISIFVVALSKYVGGSYAYELGACYILSPGLYFSSSSPHSFGINPRVFCYFLWVVIIFLLFVSYRAEIPAVVYFTFCSSFFIAAIGILSSKFFIQVYFFTVTIFIFMWDGGEPIIHLIAALAISFVLSKGRIKQILISHCEYIKWYYSNCKGYTSGQNDFIVILKLILGGNIRTLFYQITMQNILTRAILFYFPFFAFAFYLLQYNPHGEYALILICTSFCFFILTLFWPFRIFGDAERYVKYIYPLVIALMSSINQDSVIVYSLFCFNALFIFIMFLEISKKKKCNDELKEVAEITSRYKEALILPAQHNDRYYLLEYTKNKILGFFVQLRGESKDGNFSKDFFIKYPVVNLDNNLYVDKYLPEFIIVNKGHPQIKNKNISVFNKWNVFYETKNYILLKIDSLDADIK